MAPILQSKLASLDHLVAPVLIASAASENYTVDASALPRLDARTALRTTPASAELEKISRLHKASIRVAWIRKRLAELPTSDEMDTLCARLDALTSTRLSYSAFIDFRRSACPSLRHWMTASAFASLQV